ncbi:Cd(II)/Pb(II)-responsive transcriptional regulator [Parapusillimonas granuli]|uniref:Cd(II)/Pb(II)-responsive transcriptional regulator n=1 Tax=Parapusillimonas granuli TaxID=380911 RepID=A0A853FVS7_9BURK|nr:Cd(II)/Pb(II)-responsive transcriptional regulator [Parapusillimonas granuli]MBB5213428.1 Cd(II)/Pb(II)-responsive transcriptional regulator [Parapusillimonas granuli]NYT48267.1 Cd(II)/Pb(II)-responsive transcriptional regulator [Parapusillimonas granuli]
MKIGELAKAANCGTETIRFYEREGLLPAPERTEGNYRSYQDEHLERLRFVRNCRSLDMTHDEIRQLLRYADQPGSDCGPVNRLLDEHIEHVDIRLNELRALRALLAGLRQRCEHADSVAHCGIIQGLASMPTEEKQTPRTHLG